MKPYCLSQDAQIVKESANLLIVSARQWQYLVSAVQRMTLLSSATDAWVIRGYRQVRTGGPAVNIGVRMDPRVVEGSVNISEQILFVKRMDSANRIALSESEIPDH